jgi:hypothetical protein
MCHLLCHIEITQAMQSITLRQLRDTRKVKAWLRAGVHIEVRERNEVIGDLSREPRPKQAKWNGLTSPLDAVRYSGITSSPRT